MDSDTILINSWLDFYVVCQYDMSLLIAIANDCTMYSDIGLSFRYEYFVDNNEVMTSSGSKLVV